MNKFELSRLVKAFLIAGTIPASFSTALQAQENECSETCIEREQQGKVVDDSRVLLRPMQSSVEQYLPDEVWTLPRLPDRISAASINRIENEINQDGFDPALFESGKSDLLPEARVSLTGLVERFRDRQNLRLHFVGHTDNQPLSANAREIYRDNQGLSERRAEAVADFSLTSCS